MCQVDELQTELSAAVQSHKDESARIQADSSAAVHSQKEFARKQIEQVQEEYKELVASLREALGEEVTTRAEVAKLCDEIRVLTADRDNVRRQANKLLCISAVEQLKRFSHSRFCQVGELRTELSAAVQSHKDESARMVAEQEEYKVLVASLRGEVGRLSEQLRLVSAERDRADAMRAASQSGREVEELQKQLLESLRAEVARHAEQHQIATAERDEMRKQACELGSGLCSMPLLRPFAVAGV